MFNVNNEALYVFGNAGLKETPVGKLDEVSVISSELPLLNLINVLKLLIDVPLFILIVVSEDTNANCVLSTTKLMVKVEVCPEVAVAVMVIG